MWTKCLLSVRVSFASFLHKNVEKKIFLKEISISTWAESIFSLTVECVTYLIVSILF